MNICFFTSKGGASKTTYARIVAEYFNRIEKDVSSYKSNEQSELKLLFGDKPFIRVFNITRHEVSIRRYKSYVNEFNDILPHDNKQLNFMISLLDDSKETISLFDIGADVHDEFIRLESEEYGKTFFSKMDIVFVPIKYDQDSIQSAFNATQLLQKYSNISFVYCLTEYLHDLKTEFVNFFTHKSLMPLYYTLQAGGRAKLISVQYSRFIRESDTCNETLDTYCGKMTSQTDRNECLKFRKEIFAKLDNAFFDFDRSDSIISDFKKTVTVGKFDHDLIIDRLNIIQSQITELATKPFVATHNKDHFTTIENDLKLALNRLEIFSSPSLEVVAENINDLYRKYSKKMLFIIALSIIGFPFLMFAIIGFFLGGDYRDIKARNEAQKQMQFLNEFSKELYKSGALEVLDIQYSPDRNTVSIVCKEDSGKCTNRFDEKTNTGYIEVMR